MKTTIAIASLIAVSAASFAQVEQDDMYFRKKDRAKLNEQKAMQQKEVIARGEKSTRFDYKINKNQSTIPTSSREVNPEYISRSQSEMVAGEGEGYFMENYQYASQNQFNDFNNNLNNWNNAPLYSNAYFAPSIYGWNSPYYTPFNDPFLMGYNSNPWCNPYFRSGWSVSFSFGRGQQWGNYGWMGNGWMGNGFGYNNHWGNPYWGWNNGWGMWDRHMYNNWYYPTVVVVDGAGRGPVYGKRGSRSTYLDNVNNAQSRNSRSNSSRSISDVQGGGSNSNAARSTGTNDYYTPKWRRSPQGTSGDVNSSRSFQNTTGGNTFNRSSQPQRSSNTFSAPSQQRSSAPTYSAPSRSSSSGSSSGGSRSSSPPSRGRGGN